MPDLTGLPALDLAIGLSFIFLLLSLLASAVQEYIAGLLKLRANTLWRGLANMLEGSESVAKPSQKPTVPVVTSTAPVENGTDSPKQEPERGANLTASIYQHPLIRSFYKKGRGLLGRGDDRLPSYISPRSFALALLGTLAPGSVATQPDGRPRNDHDVIAALHKDITDSKLTDDTKMALLGLLDDARGDVDKFRKNIEQWFDDTMARVSGWYKRQAQLILVAIAVVVTLALNANTLTMAERLWKDPALRTAIVVEAGKVTDDQTPSVETAAENIEKVKKLGVPLGWTSKADDPRYVAVSGDDWAWQLLIRHIAGWLLTIAAISLGAPFWFDTLSRFSRLRNSGKPEAPLPASAYGKPGERVT